MFSGTVKDLTGKPLTGPVDLNFAIYKEQTDAAPLWQESQTLNVDEQGHYTALLGAMQAEGLPVDLFTSGEARWLGLSVGKLPEQPRVLLVSVPYALKANDAEMLGGKPASAYALAPAAESATSQGTGTPGATGPRGAATPDVAAPGKPKSGPKPNVAGTGTQNYIPRWTDSAGTLGNSVIYQTGGLLGVGTAAPGAAVDVYGTNAGFQLRGPGTHQVALIGATRGRLGQDAVGFFFSSDTNGAPIRFATNNGSGHEWLRITSAGKVGIGTAAPAHVLDVVGDISASTNLNAGGNLSVTGTLTGNGSGLTNVTAVTAATASGLSCTGCVGNTQLGVNYAASAAQGGPAANALLLNGYASSAFQPAGSYATLGSNAFVGGQTITGNVSLFGTLNGVTIVPSTSAPCTILGSASTCVSANILGGFTGSGGGSGGGHVVHADSITSGGGGASPLTSPVAGANSILNGVVGGTVSGGGGTVTGTSGTVDYHNAVSNTWGTVGGGASNSAGDGTDGTSPKCCETVGGGYGNWASGNIATIAGGGANVAGGNASTIAGGISNNASAYYAMIGGGVANSAAGQYATVGGGGSNSAGGSYATVPGGNSNTASGVASFAAGCRANAAHDNAFVWSGYCPTYPATVNSSAVGQFLALAPGGVVFYSNAADLSAGVKLAPGGSAWSTLSDRNAKENFQAANGEAFLARLQQIPVLTWNYKSQDASIRHVGPMAQDFYAAFGVGEDDKHISTVDADGVALAGLQALYRLSLKKDAEIQKQQAQIRTLTLQVQELEKVQRQIATLEARLAQIEARTAKPQPRSVKRAAAACLRSDTRNSKKSADRT